MNFRRPGYKVKITDHGVSYASYKHGRRANEVRKPWTWVFGQVLNGRPRVYLRCPECKALMSAPSREVYKNGHRFDEYDRSVPRTYRCIVCHECKWHTYAYLIGFVKALEGLKK